MARYVFCALALLLLPANAMELSSPDLQPDDRISSEQAYKACGGQNLSPELHWKNVPAGAKSLALTVVDRSVQPQGWSHWVVIDIPPNVTALAKGLKELPPGAQALVSDFGDKTYNGPCPPQGSGAHKYEITLWALKVSKLETFEDGGRSKAVWFDSDVLATARLSGTFGPR